MQKRFGFMRFMSGMFVVGGIIMAGLAIALFFSGASSTFRLLSFDGLIAVLGASALAVAFGLLIEVLLAIEENTRATSQHLEKMANRQRAVRSSDVPPPTLEELEGGKRK